MSNIHFDDLNICLAWEYNGALSFFETGWSLEFLIHFLSDYGDSYNLIDLNAMFTSYQEPPL